MSNFEPTQDLEQECETYKKKYETNKIKQMTLELYDSLPLDEEERKSRIDVRDKVFELNQKFFGFVAKHTYVVSSTAIQTPTHDDLYFDKYQSACLHFMECWWWYKWPVRYRTDLSFSVFFFPRLSEMIKRELNEVKYGVKRNLCIKAATQLNKNWTELRYEDLSKVDLPQNQIEALQAIFGNPYTTSIEDYEPYLKSNDDVHSLFTYPDNNYDSAIDFLIHEMCEQETKFTDKQLKKLAKDYCLDYNELLEARPVAEQKLYEQLKNSLEFGNY